VLVNTHFYPYPCSRNWHFHLDRKLDRRLASSWPYCFVRNNWGCACKKRRTGNLEEGTASDVQPRGTKGTNYRWYLYYYRCNISISPRICNRYPWFFISPSLDKASI